MNKKLTGLALFLLCSLLLVPAAMASNTNEGACGANEALSSLLPGTFGNTDSCTVDNLTFTFSYGSYSGSIPASNVFVNPVDTPDGPGLSFSANWTVTNGSSGQSNTEDADVSFEVSASAPIIDDVYIFFGGNTVDTINNVPTGSTGSITYNESVCTGPNDSGTCISPAASLNDPPPNENSNMGNLGAPVSAIYVTKDLGISSGSDGNASVSLFGNEYSEVPEPRAISMFLALCLMAGLLIFKRRQAAQN